MKQINTKGAYLGESISGHPITREDHLKAATTLVIGGYMPLEYLYEVLKSYIISGGEFKKLDPMLQRDIMAIIYSRGDSLEKILKMTIEKEQSEDLSAISAKIQTSVDTEVAKSE